MLVELTKVALGHGRSGDYQRSFSVFVNPDFVSEIEIVEDGYPVKGGVSFIAVVSMSNGHSYTVFLPPDHSLLAAHC